MTLDLPALRKLLADYAKTPSQFCFDNLRSAMTVDVVAALLRAAEERDALLAAAEDAIASLDAQSDLIYDSDLEILRMKVEAIRLAKEPR